MEGIRQFHHFPTTSCSPPSSSNPDTWQTREPYAASWAYEPCSLTGPFSQKDPTLSLILCCSCLEILNNFIFELVFGKWSLIGQWNMHVSSGNMTRGYACTCAEGSGSAGNPACTHTPPSSSLQPGRFLGLHGSGDGGSNSCGRPGSTGGKGLCTGAAPGPAVGSQLANPCHPHKYELTSLTLGQELLALRQQTLSVN